MCEACHTAPLGIAGVVDFTPLGNKLQLPPLGSRLCDEFLPDKSYKVLMFPSMGIRSSARCS